MKNLKKLGLCLSFAVLALLGGLFLHAPRAFAVPQQFNNNHIFSGAQYTLNANGTITTTLVDYGTNGASNTNYPLVFTDNTPNDNTHVYTSEQTYFCESQTDLRDNAAAKITLSGAPSGKTISGQLSAFVWGAGGSACSDNSGTISITNANPKTGGGGGLPSTLTYNGNTYHLIESPYPLYGLNATKDGDCYGGSVILTNSDATKGTAWVDLTSGGVTPLQASIAQAGGSAQVINLIQGCGFKDSSDNTNGYSGSISNGKLNAPTPPGAGQTGPGGTDTADSCTDDATLSWIICPIVNGLSKSADQIEDFVAGQLNFNVHDNLSDSVQKAWTIFRTLTSVLIVIVMLVMVISQAVGGGPFDAYTVRKMLPKLVAAVILMQLSWYLCIYLIQLSNDAGQAIGQLMAVPFGGPAALELGALLHRLSASGAVALGVITSGAAIFGIVTSGAIILYGWPVLLLAILLVFLALIVAIATLLFRNALIVLLVIFSPLAFLAYVLPGTDRYWKIWKDNFVKLLVFFPLVIAIIYGGRIFAWIAAGLGTAGPFDLIVVLAGFFGPYFFLPKTFKYGGTLLAKANEGINNSWPVKKGGEVARRELVSGEDSAMKRRMGHWAAEYTDVDEHGNKLPLWQRARTSMLAGRFIPTERAKRGMVSRGNAFKNKENELTTALASRRREKAASRTEDVSIGKQMDMDTVERSMNEIAEEQGKIRPNQYRIKDLEREAKEAMRDLVATGSTLEMDGMKVNVPDGKGGTKQAHVWQTGLWRDLLNGSPDLYRQVKGDAPDWVPHRNPTGLPKYRGGINNETIKRREMAAEGLTAAEIDQRIEGMRNEAGRVFLRTANGHPEYVDDVQYASALHETVTEQDAHSLSRVHPTYFERIARLAEKGESVKAEVAKLRQAGQQAEADKLEEVQVALQAPAKEFGELVGRIASTHGGRNQLGSMMGGADVMQHIDHALQFSGANGANRSQGAKWAGEGSLEAMLTLGAQAERQNVSNADSSGTVVIEHADHTPTTERVVERQTSTAPTTTTTAAPAAARATTAAPPGEAPAAAAETGGAAPAGYGRLAEAMEQNTYELGRLASTMRREGGAGRPAEVVRETVRIPTEQGILYVQPHGNETVSQGGVVLPGGARIDQTHRPGETVSPGDSSDDE